MTEAGRLEVARIGRAHGLRGEVAVTLTSDREERLAPGSALATDDGVFVVASSRRHQDRWLVRFEEISERDGAESLLGTRLYADAVPGGDDEFWVHELIGCEVRDRSGARLGSVEAVEANPASDLLVLDGERLLPLTFVVEHGGGVIVADPPAGLWE